MFTMRIDVNELDNGHTYLRILQPSGMEVSAEMATLQEALDEAYRTLARERIKCKY